jgi:GT2 family glycosyltransferase
VSAPVRVAVVIVNYRTAPFVIACLRSLAPEVASHAGLRVIVVDNASGDGEALAAAIRDHGWAWASLLIAERNGGFAYGNNRGIEAGLRWPAPPDYFLLLNPDTEARPGAIEALVQFMEAHPAAGIAGSSFENPDGSEWPLAFRFPSIWSELEHGLRLAAVSRLLRNHAVARTMGREPARVDWVSGASLMVRRRVLEEVGMMDEGYFLYYEEVDLCLKAHRGGWQCWYVPQSRVMHHYGQATGMSEGAPRLKRMPAYWFESRSRYFVKNHGVAYARLADLAFGLGRSLWVLRRPLARRPVSDPPGLLADFWRTSVLFQRGEELRRRLQASR